MNKTLIASLLVFAFSGSAYASPELAMKNKCNTCHAMDKKMLGPSWKEIAAKNKGNENAMREMEEATVKGCKGKYGKMAMPPQPNAKADANALAKWILSL